MDSLGLMKNSGSRSCDAPGGSRRLESLDVLRGFDMLFIMGFAALVVKACACFGLGEGFWLVDQMEHVRWHGLAHHDTIFPLFLFIAGATFPFSCARQRERGRGDGAIALNVLRRAAILFVLGLVYDGLFAGTLRLGSVLGRIGVAWAAAALLTLRIGWRARVAVIAAILVGYWMFLWFVPAPDRLSLAIPAGFEAFGNGPFSPTGNISGWLDRHFVPGVLGGVPGICDNQSVLGCIPATATALLGVAAGEWLYAGRGRADGTRRDVILFAWGLGLLAAGLVVAHGFGEMSFPVNKKLWSSSFVLVVGAYSTCLLALFHWLIDVKGWWRHTLFFRVIGLNSITIYLAQRAVGFERVNAFCFGGLASLMPSAWAEAFLALTYIVCCWCLLLFLHRNRIYLKV